MFGTQMTLMQAFASLVAQEASEEVILDVLVAEAALLLPSLCRDDLELVVTGVIEASRAAASPANQGDTSLSFM
jgi:GAF domain-containing protein